MKQIDGWWVPDDGLWSAAIREAKAQQVAFVLPFVKGRGLAISAGAWHGLFPLELARSFQNVLAFEPEPQTYACAKRNLAWVVGVELYHAMLADVTGIGALAITEDGLHHVALDEATTSARVQSLTVDDVVGDRWPSCDLLLLDVEGFEDRVLAGAARTIERFGPCVMLEENALLARYGRRRGDVDTWLRDRGYELAGQWTTLPPEVQNDGEFRGADLVYVRR